MKKFILFNSIILSGMLFHSSNECNAQGRPIITSNKSGDFSDNGTWSPERKPRQNDKIIISAGHIVTITRNEDYKSSSSTYIEVQGVLDFDKQTGLCELRPFAACDIYNFTLDSNDTLVIRSGGEIRAIGTITFQENYFDSPGDPGEEIYTLGSYDGSEDEVIYSTGSPYGLAITYDSIYDLPRPLPIELASFSARTLAQSVKLEWSTATEINNDFFTISKSTDGLNYENFAVVEGVGNSTSLVTYIYTDNAPLPGRSYYRLKQTDYDGKYELFDPVTVDFLASSPSITINNPVIAGGAISLTLPAVEGFKELFINSLDGKQRLKVITADNQINVNLPAEITPGIYLLTLKSPAGLQTERLVVK